MDPTSDVIEGAVGTVEFAAVAGFAKVLLDIVVDDEEVCSWHCGVA